MFNIQLRYYCYGHQTQLNVLIWCLMTPSPLPQPRGDLWVGFVDQMTVMTPSPLPQLRGDLWVGFVDQMMVL
jgi:hypothetical protein